MLRGSNADVSGRSSLSGDCPVGMPVTRLAPVAGWVGNLVTAFATMGGVLISQYVTVRIERDKRFREDTTRWLDRKLTAYAELMSAVQGLSRFASEIKDVERSPTEQDCKDLARVVTDKGELAVLLSPEMERVIADLVSSSLGLLTMALVGRHDLSGHIREFLPSSEELRGMSARAHQEWCWRYDDFVDAARRDLGVARPR